MSRILAVHLKPHEATVVVVRGGAVRPTVEAARRVGLSPDDAPQRRGEILAEAVGELNARKLPVVVALPRDGLLWQNFQLPPAPDEDLPNLVHLQAQRDLPVEDDGAGFDFLPLEGDAEHPRRVLGVGLARTAWQRVLDTLAAAQLKPRQIVPEAVGWPLLVEGHASGAEGETAGVHLGVATEPGWAAIWAAAEGAVRLLRSVRLPEGDDPDALAAVLSGELRRTRLVLGQLHPDAAGAEVYLAADHPPQELAERLAAVLSSRVIAVDAREAFYVENIDQDAGDWAAAASLGANAAAGERPVLDLLNPRKPPAPPTNMRTYALAAAAALAVAALVGWQGYRKIQIPRAAAAVAEAETEQLSEELEGLAGDQRRAATLQQWQLRSAPVLSMLADVAGGLRPETFDAEDFPDGSDVMVTKVNIVGGTLTLDGAAKDAAALQPVEARLREKGYRVDRGTIRPDASPAPGYKIGFSATLQRPETAGGAP